MQMDDVDLKIVNQLVGVILCRLNNGVAIGELLSQPRSYGARLIWPLAAPNSLSPAVVNHIFYEDCQKPQDASTRSVVFTYWEYGNFKQEIKGDSLKEMLPDNLKSLVDCIRSFGVCLEE